MARPLILVSNRTKNKDSYRQEVDRDLAPRQDYIEISERLDGEYYGYDLPEAGWYARALQIEKRLKLDLLSALISTRRLSRHSAVLSTSEKAAIPLSMLLSLTGQKKPHVLIGHHLSSPNKARLFRLWKLHRSLAHIICVCRAQADYAVNRLHFPASKVAFIHDKVDQRFFRPIKAENDGFILAVGQEQRDYETLGRAISGTGLQLVVVASSPWSTFSTGVETPQEATVLSHIPYAELRDLYARARLVVVPLFETDYAAGANAVLEAMAMAKPLVLTCTSGIHDYVTADETGVYVPPGDPAALREVVRGLWDRPAERTRLGENARQAVEETMNLDNYVDQVARILQSARV